jgi:SAM-dependent methyltransferase
VGIVTRRRVTRAVLYGVAVAHVLGTVTMRRRRTQVTALPERGPGTSDSGAEHGEADEARAVRAAGCHVSEAVLAAAAAEMEATGADVIELMPGDLAADRALSVLRWTDLDRLRDDPMYAGAGTCDAVAVRASVADRMGIPEGGESLDRYDLVRRTMDAHLHARSSSVRVAPGLGAAPLTPRDRWRELEAVTAFSRPYESLTPIAFGARTLWLLTLSAGPLVAPLPGVVALAAWSSQPLSVLAGKAPDGRRLSPGRVVADTVLRLPRAWVDHLRMIVPARRETRAAYERVATAPTTPLPPEDERFDPRRETCPWCASSAIVPMLDGRDMHQQKPGTTHLDRCADCGHVFQNPPLSLKSLDYYYEDFYTGIGRDMADFGFASMTSYYRARAEAVGRFHEPRAWLDVGAGYGHFSGVARRMWPDAVFDGLDFGDSVELGQRRGWLDTAYRGLFTEMAGSLPRSYDVVSMHHYLEHTRDPHLELAAAAKMLEPGGYLEIEVPDPESPWLNRLGGWGHLWSQPQHQHFVTSGNLAEELEKLGFEVVSVERGAANMGDDLGSAVVMWIQRHSRNPFAPWLGPPTRADRAKRVGVILAALPALVVTGLADIVKDAWIERKRHGVGNVYRLVARKI